MAKNNDPTPEELEAKKQEEEKTRAEEAARLKTEAEAKARAEQAANSAPPAPAAVTQHENGLLSLADLAQIHRVPTWQQAALHRLMSWEDGKQVTDAEYQAGLARLSGRRMGGM